MSFGSSWARHRKREGERAKARESLNSGSGREFLFSFSLLVDQGERTEFRSRVIAAAPSQFLSSHGIAAAAPHCTVGYAALRAAIVRIRGSREAGLITTSTARGAWLTCRRRAPRATFAMPLTPLGAAVCRRWGRRACRRGGSQLTTLKLEASRYTFTLLLYSTLSWKGRASTPKSIRLLHRTYGPCGCCRPLTRCNVSAVLETFSMLVIHEFWLDCLFWYLCILLMNRLI